MDREAAPDSKPCARSWNRCEYRAQCVQEVGEQSLVVTKPHIGTVVQMETIDHQRIRSEIVSTVKSALHYGVSVEDVRKIVETTLEEATRNCKSM